MAISTLNKSWANKPDLTVIKQTIKKPVVSQVISSAYSGLLCWLLIFILGQIFISGGKSGENPYFIAVMIIFLITAQLIFINNSRYKSLRSTIISALSVAITIAILDYLIINLAMNKNNLILYKYWPFYLIYLSALITPFLRSSLSKRIIPNLKLLLTKKKHSI